MTDQLTQSDWKNISTDEAYRLSMAEFKGMVLQALQDNRDDVKEINKKIDTMQSDSRIKNYINMAGGLLSGIVAGFVSGRIR